MKKSGVIKAVITILIILLIVGVYYFFTTQRRTSVRRYGGADRDTKAHHEESGYQLSGNSCVRL